MKLEPELADALGQAGGGANNGADASADNHRSEKEEKEQRTQAGILIKLAKRFGLSLFRTPDADGYADIKVKEHRETWPLRSSGFRKWLRQIYFFEEKSAPNKEALESAVETLDAEAQFSCETTHPVELRVAYHDGKIYYDLCNDRWEVVEITASGRSSPTRLFASAAPARHGRRLRRSRAESSATCARFSISRITRAGSCSSARC